MKGSYTHENVQFIQKLIFNYFKINFLPKYNTGTHSNKNSHRFFSKNLSNYVVAVLMLELSE